MNMRTWETSLVRYEEQPYKEGLNKLAAYYLGDESYLGDILPDTPDHLQHMLVAIENGICPVLEGWEVGNGKRGTIHGWSEE